MLAETRGLGPLLAVVVIVLAPLPVRLVGLTAETSSGLGQGLLGEGRVCGSENDRRIRGRL